ncbi:MAG TPA: diguanylate cyclase [Candidatus Acidoferrales bacterium]|nr:diguanylate cyclase [Candidatus Acidoferrales bacterium]
MPVQPAMSPEKSIAPFRILLIMNSEDDFDLCARALEKGGLDFSADRALTKTEFERLAGESTYDVVVADYSLAGWSGMEAYEALQSKGSAAPFIVIAGPIGEEKAVECIKIGAADCVLKTNLGALPWAVRRATEDRHIREERTNAETSLRDSERKFRVLADSIASAVLIYQGTECRYANLTAQLLTGYSEKELLELNSWDLIHPDSHPLVIEQGFAKLQGGNSESRNEIRILTKKGQVRWLDVTMGRISIDGQPAGLVTAIDVTERKLADASTQMGGLRDPLTGLLSNAQLQSAFLSEAKRSQRTGRSVALLLLKLEALKEISNQGGGMAGSRALCQISNIIGAACRTADIAARYSDDEFALVLPETSLAGVRRLAARIVEKVKSESLEFPLHLAAGGAVFPQDGPTVEHLLRSARKAMTKAESHTDRGLAISA